VLLGLLCSSTGARFLARRRLCDLSAVLFTMTPLLIRQQAASDVAPVWHGGREAAACTMLGELLMKLAHGSTPARPPPTIPHRAVARDVTGAVRPLPDAEAASDALKRSSPL